MLVLKNDIALNWVILQKRNAGPGTRNQVRGHTVSGHLSFTSPHDHVKENKWLSTLCYSMLADTFRNQRHLLQIIARRFGKSFAKVMT